MPRERICPWGTHDPQPPHDVGAKAHSVPTTDTVATHQHQKSTSLTVWGGSLLTGSRKSFCAKLKNSHYNQKATPTDDFPALVLSFLFSPSPDHDSACLSMEYGIARFFHDPVIRFFGGDVLVMLLMYAFLRIFSPSFSPMVKPGPVGFCLYG